MPTSTFSETLSGPAPGWSRTDLKRPGALLAAIAGFTITTPAAVFSSCQVHEIGHGLVGTLLGWRVERVNLCLPSWGSVDFSVVPETRDWTWFTVGFTGPLIAAAFLVGIYYVVFARRARPLQGPGWWAAGLGVVLWAPVQFVIGVLEGVAEQRGDDYTAYLSDHPAVFLPLLGVAAAAGAAAYTWRWRSVWIAAERDLPVRG